MSVCSKLEGNYMALDMYCYDKSHGLVQGRSELGGMLKGQATGNRVPEEFEALVRPHVDSYNYFIGEGMHVVVENLDPIEVRSQQRVQTAPPDSARLLLTISMRQWWAVRHLSG